MNMNNILPASIKTDVDNVQKSTDKVMQNATQFAQATPKAQKKFLEIYGTPLRGDLGILAQGDENRKELWILDANGTKIINTIKPDGTIEQPGKQAPSSIDGYSKVAGQIEAFGNNLKRQARNVMHNIEKLQKATPAAKEKFFEIYGSPLRADLWLDAHKSDPLGLNVFDAAEGGQVITEIKSDGSIVEFGKRDPRPTSTSSPSPSKPGMAL